MTDPAKRRLPRRAVLFVFLAGWFAFIVVAGYAFLNAGNWLIREDPLERSRVIFVPSGGLPERALTAAELFRSGYAAEVWISRPLQPRAAMEQLRLPFAGEEEYSRMVLIEKGVPTLLIRILPDPVQNTADELTALSRALQELPDATAVVVTSKAHTRRVRAVWNRVSRGHRGRLLVRAASNDHFDGEHWWRTSNDALSVVREYLGLLNAWSGLPLYHS
jgi:uncharacterized SAM-binding protein YcdF (DUF218 family)